MVRRALSFVVTTALTAGIVLTSACHRENGSTAAVGANIATSKVVLYCATDREIAQDLIDQFEKETGIRVEAKFDTEAAKSVGLVQAIRQEKTNPQ